MGLLNVHLDIELGGGGERLDDVPALELVVVGVAVGEEDEERLDPQRAAEGLEVVDARALAVPAGDPARLEAVDGAVVLVEDTEDPLALDGALAGRQLGDELPRTVVLRLADKVISHRS